MIFSISQTFNNQESSPPALVSAVTANPVVLSSAITASGAAVYDAPTAITLNADRDVQAVSGVSITQNKLMVRKKNITAK